MKVEVISKELIKPSSPTPDHLRTYHLSFLDQISPPVHNPLVIFYSSEPDTKFNIVDISNQLKKSLSDVLTLFYPLAGRAHGNLFIDCNDEGIPYFETRVNCQLSHVIQNPIPTELNKFIPFQLHEVADLSLGVQLNVFDCGGIALGACVSHKIADALSLFMFIKSWAAIARQQDEHIVCPQFVSATLFPPRNISGFNPRTGITKQNVVTRRFIFDASKIEALKAKYSIDNYSQSLESYQKPPSRVEALSAFIWSRVVASTQVKSEPAPERLYAVVHAVNLRTRIDPPLPEHSFGNLYRIAMTIPSLQTGEECYGLVRQVRDQVRQIDKHYVSKLQQGSEHLDFIKQSSENFFKGEMVTLNFTSLCRFPLYEADFGWGKPTWVGSPPLTFNNLVIFMDAKSKRQSNHLLHHHQLSFLDQLAPHAYVPFLYFYEFNGSINITQISNLLKTSLSIVLTQYYPFAGRVRNNLFVHCKDQGIPFSEVKVKNHLLSAVITNPCLSELHKLLPFKLDEVTETALGVQLNVFECGGIAVGLCISHRIADARSCFTFVNNWAAASNCGQGNKNSIVGPDFSAASIFPPRNMDGYLGVPITNRHEIKTKKFVFDVSKVEALRSKYEQSIKISKTQKRPSKVEALSAFLWDIFVLSRPRERPQTLYAVVNIMDLRSRLKPPLPHHTFGNYYGAAMAAPTLPTSEKHHGSVRQVIEEIEKIDSNYMWKFERGFSRTSGFHEEKKREGCKRRAGHIDFF